MISIGLQDFGIDCDRALQSLAIGHRLLNVGLTLALLSSSYLSAYRSESYQRRQWIRSTMKEQLTRESLTQAALSKAALLRDLNFCKTSFKASFAFCLLEDFLISSGSIDAADAYFGEVNGESFLSLLAAPDRDQFIDGCHLEPS